MISQEEIGFKSSQESRFSPPKQRASSVQAVATAPGGLIYDPASGSLRYPRFTQLPAGLKSEKQGANVAFSIHVSSGGGIVGKSNSCRIAGEKHSGLLHGGPDDHQSAESSPRCVIGNSVLDSSTSTSPSGSKSMREMDDYSDVKQLITHNRSSSPSDADDDPFYSSSNIQKELPSSGFRPSDSARGDSARQKNLKGNADVGQKVYLLNGNHHSRSISTSSVPGVDSFQKLVGNDQHETSELESIHDNNAGSSDAILPGRSSIDSAMMDSGGGLVGPQVKSRGGSGLRSSQSHELLRAKDNGWGGENGEGSNNHSAATMKNSSLDPILESLMKASIMKDGAQFRYQQNQIAEKIEEMKRKNAMKASLQSSFSHGGPGAFSFNQTHIARVSDADLLDYENNYDTVSNSSFDFNKGGDIKGVHRTVLTNFAKPAPSKWDDAEKWLSSEPPLRSKAKSGPTAPGPLALSKKAAFLNQAGRLIPNISNLAKLATITGTPANSGSEASSSGGDAAIGSNNDGEEVTKSDQDSSKVELTKKIDVRAKFVTNNEDAAGAGGASRFVFMPAATGAPPGSQQTAINLTDSLDRYPLDDLFGREKGDAKEGSTSPDPSQLNLLDPALRTEKPTSDSPPKEDASSKLEVAKSDQATAQVHAAPKVCMRDMGTAMTPIASVEPSRAPTPVCVRTPSMRSPSSSRPATPSRVAPTSTPTSETEKKVHYTDKELQSKTRQEILALGTQLGKHNIAAWATKEEEEEDAFKSLKNNVDLEEVRKNVIATRAAAWEEAEQAKYMARFRREEAKILAWENHEKAKAEAEMRRIEMKIERMRSHANERLMNKLAATRRSAEELRAAAAARRGEQASKTSQRAEYIRRTGKVPGSMFASFCCS
ncbi:unnamed protein product [Calypogeia fissa]